MKTVWFIDYVRVAALLAGLIVAVDVTRAAPAIDTGATTPGFTGDGGLSVNTLLENPEDLVVDPAGNVFFVDEGNNVVRRFDAMTGIITTIAGMGNVPGDSGDDSPATSATLMAPLVLDLGELVNSGGSTSIINNADLTEIDLANLNTVGRHHPGCPNG